MFFHDKRLQYNARPERPDPVFARKLQEVLGGQWGEISVMRATCFQGWNCRGPSKYRDMIIDIGTEEISHVEMLATMIARLLEKGPVDAQEEAARDPMVAAVLGGMNPQHVIVTGLGASPTDSVGYPWNARYTIASGNLLADFRYNLTAESQGRLQVCRLYEMTTDRGVRDMLSFLIARDTMHQNQWLAAIEELKATTRGDAGAERVPAGPGYADVAYQFWNVPNYDERGGRWASGLSPDGKGEFQYPSPAPSRWAGDPELNEAEPLASTRRRRGSAARDGGAGGELRSAAD